MTTPSGTSERGFAAMDQAKQREIASKGGVAAHESGHAHEFTPQEAREAGRKGGESVSQNREHMAEIGRKGGEASHGGTSGRESGGQVMSQGSKERGFAAMDEEKQRDIARKGGDVSHGGKGSAGGSSQRAGSAEQHAKAGRQSHANR